MCEEVSQDSGYRHEESHLIHDMKKKIHVGLHFLYGMWYDVCVPLHVHFRWGVALVREFLYLAFLYYGKRVVIGLLQIVIKCFIFIF